MHYAKEKPPRSLQKPLDFYDELLGEYDQMMDWESRLTRETPFFEKIISDYQIKSLLDAGCGTGRHCFHFLTMGLDAVVGADASERVIELARHRAAAIGGEIDFVQAEFTDLAKKVSGSYQLVCCLGNSISHLLSYDDLELALKNFRKLTTKTGIVLLHLLNWERKIALQERYFPLRSHPMPEGEKLFLRFLDFHDELVTMNLIIFQKDSTPQKNWYTRVSSTTLRPWRREILQMAIKDADLVIEREYGGMNLSPFNQKESPDYLVIARRG